MRRNWLFKAAVWMWTLAAVTAVILPGSLAKYSASAEAAASARVAQWGPLTVTTASPWNASGGAKILFIRKNVQAGGTAGGNLTLNSSLTLANGSEVAARFRIGFRRAYDGSYHFSNMLQLNGLAWPGNPWIAVGIGESAVPSVTFLRAYIHPRNVTANAAVSGWNPLADPPTWFHDKVKIGNSDTEAWAAEQVD